VIVVATIVALAVVLAQGAAVWAFLRFVNSFGAYTASQQDLTAALLYTHESNMALHESNRKLFERLAVMQAYANAKEVA
jgi:hypothetical protein